MQEYANILHEFNGGASCVKRYISLLKMFFDTESLEMDEVLADQGTYTAKCANSFTFSILVTNVHCIGFPNRVQQLDSFELASARITQFYDEIIESCKKEYLVCCLCPLGNSNNPAESDSIPTGHISSVSQSSISHERISSQNFRAKGASCSFSRGTRHSG